MTTIAPSESREQLVGEMCLERFREARNLTWRQLAELIGASSAGRAYEWATGQVRPSDIKLHEIAERTGGVVSVYAMHRKRLEWERSNAPKLKFHKLNPAAE